MFGYVRACKPELRVKELEMYKAAYCTLCREMGKRYGFLTRFTLSYDFAFVCLLNMSLNQKQVKTERKCCKCNPLKRCNYICEKEDFSLPSAAAVILLYYKLSDNVDDEKGLNRIFCRAARRIFSSAHKKAAKDYPQIEEIFSRYIALQKATENENCQSIDKAAEPTANSLGEAFALLCDDPAEKRILSRLGYCIGRYVYILDASVDLPEDIKKNAYNPLKQYAQDKDYIKNMIVPSLYVTMSEAAKALELLDVKKFKNILDNIVYLGLEDTMKKELKI